MQTSSNVGIEREENNDEDIYPPFEESKGQSELVSNDGGESHQTHLIRILLEEPIVAYGNSVICVMVLFILIFVFYIIISSQ
jgi:hypothetical protein